MKRKPAFPGQTVAILYSNCKAPHWYALGKLSGRIAESPMKGFLVNLLKHKGYTNIVDSKGRQL
jgi:hypothetical protein